MVWGQMSVRTADRSRLATESPRGGQTRRRAGAWIVTPMVAAAIALLSVGVVPASAVASGIGAGRLKITVVVPSGRRPGVVAVDGPGHYRRTLRGTAVLKGLRPGTYNVSARPIGVGRGEVEYASVRKRSVRIVRRQLTMDTVGYGTIAKSSVRALARAPLQVLGPADNPTGVVVPVASNLRVGQVIGYPPTAAQPAGVFGVVTAVRKTGSNETASFRQASLGDAFSKINLSEQVPVDLSGAATANSAHAAGLGAAFGWKALSCGTGSALKSLSLGVSYATLNLDLYQQRSFGPLAGSVTVDLAAKPSISLEIQGNCALTVPLTGDPRFVTTIPIGPFQVPVWAAVSLSVSADLGRPLQIDRTESIGAISGFSFNGTSVTPINNIHRKTITNTNTYGGGALNVQAGPMLNLYLGAPAIKGSIFVLDANASVGPMVQLTNKSGRCQINLFAQIQGALEAATNPKYPFTIGVGPFTTPPQQVGTCPWANSGAPRPPTPTGPGTTPSAGSSCTNGYAVPSPNSNPTGITTGPDGALWFTEQTANKIGRVTPAGVFTEYPLPTNFNYPSAIALGSDGALWFTENNSRIVRITTGGAMTVYPLPAAFYDPGALTAGPDGALWFTGDREIGRITTSGNVTEYSAPISPSSESGGLTVGPDAALWFTEYNGIGRISTTGVVTDYPVSGGPSAQTWGITSGPDGALWFTEFDSAQFNGNKIGRITTTGVITEYPLPADYSYPTGITAGPDGALWFAENGGNRIGRITTAGAVREYALAANCGPVDITTGPDGALWFTEQGGSPSMGEIAHIVP